MPVKATLQIRRGTTGAMPTLEDGQLYHATDTHILWIGTPFGNVPFNSGAGGVKLLQVVPPQTANYSIQPGDDWVQMNPAPAATINAVLYTAAQYAPYGTKIDIENMAGPGGGLVNVLPHAGENLRASGVLVTSFTLNPGESITVNADGSNIWAIV